jgi:hypothetical protein
MQKVTLEAERRHVELVIVPTSEALRLIENESAANAILRVTCWKIMYWQTCDFTGHTR